MWAVAIVPVTHQKRFRAEAKKHCTRIYIPLIRYHQKLKHTHKPVVMEKPAFGSYIFVKIKEGHLRKLLDLKTCKGFVMSKDQVADVLPRTIRQIRALEAMNFDLPPIATVSKPINVGDQVRIDIGAFEGNVGRVLNLLRKGTVEIAMGNMTFSVAVDKIRPV
jgi:transcription antitermination factor NusG